MSEEMECWSLGDQNKQSQSGGPYSHCYFHLSTTVTMAIKARPNC